MALTSALVRGGWEPEEVDVSCTVALEVGVGIVSSKLSARVSVDGEIPPDKLRETAEGAKLGCPVSKALAGVEITLDLPDLPPAAEAAGAEVGTAAEE
jgi:osmotically inducible protein OsmC